MVKILANGDIVPDNDPRAQASSGPTRRREKQEESKAPSRPAAGAAGGTEDENVIVGDLARMVGVYGKTQQVMGHEIPWIYLIVGALLALLWFSGNTAAIRMMAFGLFST
eukprot:Skav221396  [mRNA]  locus=scaffold1029:264660:273841:+ [translate_table: standard]